MIRPILLALTFAAAALTTIACDDFTSTPLQCHGADGTVGCPCRHPGPVPCSDPSATCSIADVCVLP